MKISNNIGNITADKPTKVNKYISLEKQRARAGILFTLPAILGLLIFTAGPMVVSLFLSFTKWDILGQPQWVGFKNYVDMFATDLFFKKSMEVTFKYALGSIVVIMIYSLLVALLLNQSVKGTAIFRTIYYIPSIVPAVASSVLWLWMFNPDFGLLNMFLQFLGLPKSMWIFGEKTVIPSLILMSAWGAGNTVIIFLAGLQDVPRELHEAVAIDGGSWYHKLWYVTLPLITPIIFYNLIMGLIGAFQAFNQAFIMTQGGPDNNSLFYNYLLYREAFENNNMGYACSMAWILFIIIGAFTLLVFKTSKRWVYYGGGE